MAGDAAAHLQWDYSSGAHIQRQHVEWRRRSNCCWTGDVITRLPVVDPGACGQIHLALARTVLPERCSQQVMAEKELVPHVGHGLVVWEIKPQRARQRPA